MRQGEQLSGSPRRKVQIFMLLKAGRTAREVSEMLGVGYNSVCAIQNDMNYGLLHEWEKVTRRLRLSGYDLSRIPITKKG